MNGMGDIDGDPAVLDTPAAASDTPAPRPRQTRFLRRAQLMVKCALEIPGARVSAETGQIHLDLSSKQFEAELRRRYGRSHPDLVFRADSTFERARLDRHRHAHLPRVILRQGSPPKRARSVDKLIDPSCLVRQDE